MIPRPHYDFPKSKQALIEQGIRLEWITLGVLISIAIFMMLTMGGSQSMKTAFAENVLGMVPPIAFLASMPFRKRSPNEDFPYGYQRATNIAFLCGAVALCAFGVILFFDAGAKLIAGEHPSVGGIVILGHLVWKGWPMIAVLVYSGAVPAWLGRKKLPLAHDLHEKALHSDARMNRADWMSDGAAIIGVLGIGIGWWWLDSLAALLISLEICHDGWLNLWESVTDLMDRRPLTVKDQNEGLPQMIEEELCKLDWVREAVVRVREEGTLYCGEGFIVPRDEQDLVRRIEAARDMVHSLDWQLYELVLMPVSSLDVIRVKPPGPEHPAPEQGGDDVGA